MSNLITTEHDCKYPVLIKTRAPASMREAVKRAADRKMTSGSEYIRQAILGQLRSDGIDPADDSANLRGAA